MMNCKKIIMLAVCGILMLSITACAPKEEEPTYPPVSLSNDILSFEFGLNGHKFTLPVEYQEFVDNKWVFTGSWEEILEPDEYTNPYQIMYDGKNANSSASMFNSAAEDLAAKNCKIAKFEVRYSATSYVPHIELPKGITMKSTYEDVIAAYGEPDMESNESINKLTYRIDEYKYVEIDIDTADNSIFEICIANYLSDYEIEQ